MIVDWYMYQPSKSSNIKNIPTQLCKSSLQLYQYLQKCLLYFIVDNGAVIQYQRPRLQKSRINSRKINLYMLGKFDISKALSSDFLQSDLFQKNNKKKSGIPSVPNSMDQDQVQCVLSAILIQTVCEKRQA